MILMKDKENLHFSNEALSNRSLFLAQFNDVNIYVEDVGQEYAYEEIFERLFESKLTIFSIFPLGGKSAVLGEHASRNLRDNNGKLNIFIVDGDFDNLWKDQRRDSPNLIYLSRYNIESYYYSKEAVIEYMRSFCKCPRAKITATIQLDCWEDMLRNNIGELFILFATVNRWQPMLPNVKLGSKHFLDDRGCVIPEKYTTYLAQIIDNIPGCETHIEQVRHLVVTLSNDDETSNVLSIICGKFLLDSLCRHLTNCCGKNMPRDSFKAVLISSFDISTLNFLKEKVVSLLECASIS